MLVLKTGPIIIFTPSSYNSFETFNDSSGLDFVFFGKIIILGSFILLTANLIDLTIDFPIP